MSDRARTGVFLRTLGVAGGYALAIWLVHGAILSKRFHRLALSLTLAFSLAQCVAILLLGSISVVKKALSQGRERRRRTLRPEILDRLAKHATQSNQLSELKRLCRNHPDEVEACLDELSPSIVGAARDRLAQLAIELKLAQRWENQYHSGSVETRLQAITRLGGLAWLYPTTTLLRALEDEENSIRIEAMRILMRSGGRAEAEIAFEFALTQPLLVRAILCEDLRPHALTLCERVLPRALASGDARLVRTALELFGAWRKVLPLPDFPLLLRHADPEVRAMAFRALPYVAGMPEVQTQVLSGLADKDERVKIAAALAAGRMKVDSALPLLSRLLRETRSEIVLVAAYALAEMGPCGTTILEDGICSPSPVTAGAALEALERAKIDRHEYPGL